MTGDKTVSSVKEEADSVASDANGGEILLHQSGRPNLSSIVGDAVNEQEGSVGIASKQPSFGT